MTISFNHKGNAAEIRQINVGECFKINNYSVFIMTADESIEDCRRAVSLLTGISQDFPNHALVDRVDAEVVVNG